MSKIRNSLGVVVLPVPDEELSWEEYKAKYGIDLYSLFTVSESNNAFHPSKLLAITGLGPKARIGETIFDVELVKSYSLDVITEKGVTVANVLKLTAVLDEKGGGYASYCGIQLIHYTDGRDNPYKIKLFIN